MIQMIMWKILLHFYASHHILCPTSNDNDDWFIIDSCDLMGGLVLAHIMGSLPALSALLHVGDCLIEGT